jgi:hypothetical protein
MLGDMGGATWTPSAKGLSQRQPLDASHFSLARVMLMKWNGGNLNAGDARFTTRPLAATSDEQIRNDQV